MANAAAPVNQRRLAADHRQYVTLGAGGDTGATTDTPIDVDGRMLGARPVSLAEARLLGGSHGRGLPLPVLAKMSGHRGGEHHREAAIDYWIHRPTWFMYLSYLDLACARDTTRQRPHLAQFVPFNGAS